MLFMNRSPLDIEATKPLDDNHSKYSNQHQSNAKTRYNLTRISVFLILAYFAVSAACALFFLPLSLVAIVFPVLALILTINAIHSKRISPFWICILISLLGTMLKLIACIVYASLFTISNPASQLAATNNHRGTSLKARVPTAADSNDPRTAFYGIMTIAELVLTIIACCVQWHILAFDSCTSNG